MRLIPSLLSPLLLATSALSSSLTITIPPSALLPNPNVLPAGTHATLTTLSNPNPEPLSAPLSRSATFSFRDIPSTTTGGSYLLDIRSAEYVFAPYRVDVAPDGKVLGVWETFRGNPWENRGAEKFNVVVDVDASAGGGGRDVRVEAGVLARRGFLEQRAVFSPISLFKNPMIFLAVVALGFTFGMPKLMENMDPEMRAEFEKQSRSSPISGSARNAINGGGGPGNFDLAGWMAGTAPGPIGGAEPAEKAPVTTGREGGGATRRRG